MATRESNDPLENTNRPGLAFRALLVAGGIESAWTWGERKRGTCMCSVRYLSKIQASA
jgi:hypothetical protein